MTLNVWDLFLLLILLALACGTTFAVSRRAFRRGAEKLTRDSERKIGSLREAVQSLETKIAELNKATSIQTPVSAPAPAAVLQPQPAAASKAVPASAAAPEEEITPDLLVVIAAAVTAFLGKKVRIRSARMLQSPYEIVNPWAQQGRIFVQASHNLRSRG